MDEDTQKFLFNNLILSEYDRRAYGECFLLERLLIHE